MKSWKESLRMSEIPLIQFYRADFATEMYCKKFTEVFRIKYGTFMEKSQSSVFCPEKFRKFYKALFCNRLY